MDFSWLVGLALLSIGSALTFYDIIPTSYESLIPLALFVLGYPVSRPGWKDGKILVEPTIRVHIYPHAPKPPRALAHTHLRTNIADPKTIICYDPATGRHLASIPAPTPADVAEAYARVKRAQEKWAKTTFEERRRVLRSLLDFIVENQEDISRVAVRDSGKTMIDATLGEIITTCAKLRWTIDNGEQALADDYRAPGLLMMYKNAKVVYQPLGVVAALVSWNYPFHNTFGPLISAIFAGNGILIKCSEYVAWSTSYWSAIMRTCLAVHGHDPELVQFINGFADVGEAIVTSGVNHITFIGSPEVGKKVQLNAADHLVPCLLELGGKDCAIVLKDADLGQVTSVLMRGVFQNCGQNCIGIERIIMENEIYDGFVKDVEARIKELRLGSVLDDEEGVDCGAMTMGTQNDKLETLITDAVSKGARLLVGGKRYSHPRHPSGQYFSPTLLVDVTPEMNIARHEVFAPIMVLMRAKDAEDALRIANTCPYGLCSSVFSGNSRLAEQLCLRLKTGMANVNDFGVNYLCQSLPFGGVGISGYGRFAGAEGLRGLCVPKAVTIDKISFIKTSIPPPVDYPIKKAAKGYGFVKELVRFAYAPQIMEKVKGGLGLAKASL
ncbi:Aldehyde/histidinol dehydrogenase [Jimgerdemannia flammicorona]|uniref:Aldehyde/histidinol dehydrogenase n=1 Tax=Jimgerdemannia flammicorona TaxID=994334 RepID=A0A433D8S8_9FUNG|nr:Aldehyde/histidinol dehydrogenase [Jimgerdemannia flammicorona]